MSAAAVDLRALLHRCTLGAAIGAVRWDWAGARRMRAFLLVLCRHWIPRAHRRMCLAQRRYDSRSLRGPSPGSASVLPKTRSP